MMIPVSESVWPVSEDAVRELVDRANFLLAQSHRDPARVDEFAVGVAKLTPRDLVRFDEQSRSWMTGIAWDRLPELRGELPPGEGGLHRRWFGRGRSAPSAPTEGELVLWRLLALVSGDGYERERAIRSAQATALSARLLTLRCIDWVQQVRDAALSWLDSCPQAVLVEALPLAVQLASERSRGQLIDALLDARLSDEDLRQACRAGDARTRRAAWRRLVDRGAVTSEDVLEVAVHDGDVVVRAIAGETLQILPVDQKRAVAQVLVEDRVGWIAALALAALVETDGPQVIRPALTGRSAPLRRAARDWASLRGIDARAVYVECLASDSQDVIALMALAELGDPRDAYLFTGMLSDPRSRVRAAGLRGLVRVDRDGARSAAIDVLASDSAGRLARVAASVLGDGVPTATEVEILERVALDPSRPDGQRLRAMSLLRPSRWLHLAVLLEAQQQASEIGTQARLGAELRAWSGARIGRAPDGRLRGRIERVLPTLDANRRRSIEFILRTSR